MQGESRWEVNQDGRGIESRGGRNGGDYWRLLPLSDQPADPGDRHGGAEQGSSHPAQASGCLQYTKKVNKRLGLTDSGGSLS